MNLISFGSDNHAGIHPDFLKIMESSNQLFAPSYGTDESSIKFNEYLQKLLGCKYSMMVFNGTAANVISIGSQLKSYQSVICSDVSHLNVDECGSPEKIAGCKLVSVPSHQGKISPQEIKKALIRRGDQHYSQVKMISITQPTELGTVYTLNELAAITRLAREENLLVHMDGSRLPNALFYLKTDFKNILNGIDVLSLGGTKNGMLFGEIVAFFEKSNFEDAKFYRKQYLQLPSKTRFMADTFLHYYQSGLYLKIAEHQHQMAKYLESQLLEIPKFEITQPVQSNAVFAKIPKEVVKKVREKYFFYVWNESTFECRLMTSFATEKSMVDGFVNCLREFC